MTKQRKPGLSAGQQAALAGFRALAAEHPTVLRNVARVGVDDDGRLLVRLTLGTNHIAGAPEGMPLNAVEDVNVAVPAWFPLVPPVTSVNHDRWVGYPHVLQGERLCIYLDGTREWHPKFTVVDYMNRLDEWLTDAATAAFDPRTALYHAVGGVSHQTPGTPTVVVRSLPDLDGRPFKWASLRARTEDRLDLVDTNEAGTVPALVIQPAGPMHLGAGHTVPGLLLAFDRVGHPTPDAVAARLAETARRANGSHAYFVVAVPADPQPHLLAGRLPVDDSRRLARAAKHPGAFFAGTSGLPLDSNVEWCAVSDERPHVTRRDSRRPVSAFAGITVELWGCGALGSWAAEWLVRAGVRRIVLRDPGHVLGGLLVRQNYTESDVGRNKAEALADRLRSIADRVTVHAVPENALGAVVDGRLPECDVLVDATVNTAVAVVVEDIWKRSAERPLVARIATDTPTATLALLTVCAADAPDGPVDLDQKACEAVAADSCLERYAVFWEDVPGSGFVPAPGCSLPTFHGAASDVAAVAARVVSLLAPHLAAGGSGSYLAAVTSTAGEASHHWIPA